MRYAHRSDDHKNTLGLTMKNCSLFLFAVLLCSSLAARAEEGKASILPHITILSTMVASFLGEGEWGFSALLEYEDEVILFDTGFKAETVNQNATYLNKDLSRVETVILTHFHTDHTGGLLTLRRAFREQNPRAFTQVYVAKGFFEQRYFENGEARYSLPNPGLTESFSTPQAFRAAAEALGITFVVVDDPLNLRPGVFLSGPIPRVHDERNVSPGFFLKDAAGELVADNIPESQVLGLKSDDGWTLISGCGHAGIVNATAALTAIDKLPVVTAIGGFHLFRASEATIDWTAQALQQVGLQTLVGAHCTGAHATQRLADILGLPRASVSIGAIGSQIDPAMNIIRSSVE